MSRRRQPELVELAYWWGDPLAPEPEPQIDPWVASPSGWWPDWGRRFDAVYEAARTSTDPSFDAHRDALDAIDAERKEVSRSIVSNMTEARHLFGLFAWPPHWVIVAVREYRGEIVPVSVEVRSYPTPEGEIPKLRKVESLRELPLEDCVTSLRREYLADLVIATTGTPDRTLSPADRERRSAEAAQLLGTSSPIGEFAEPLMQAIEGGRKRLTAGHYRDVARVYSSAADKPRRAVARKWNVSESTAARWIDTARNKFGFLPPTSPGIAKAQSTDELASDRRRKR